MIRNKKDGQGISYEEILANSLGFIVAGSETTATALAGLTIYLTENKKAYRRLTEEIHLVSRQRKTLT
jgi:cytochrome P450